ncbi:MAG: fatty acid desaturase family protein [Acidimicrobiales bacterium]
MKITLTLSGFLLGWTAFFLVGNSWAVLGVAVILSVLSTQVLFLGHDAGHQQIAGSRRINRAVGLVAGNALTGVSFGWWVPKHNAHHAYPNQVDRDPDLGNGLVAFTTSTGTEASRGIFVRLRARVEVWLFVLLLLLQGLGLHVTSVRSIVQPRRRHRFAVLEGMLLLGNATLYLLLVFWVLSPTKAAAFVAIQQGLFGLYLGFSFAPNHKGMPIIGRDERLPFVERQVTTARNVTGGRLTTMVLGGLNYQIEHHLFPTMPRPNLARAQRIVQAFCAEQGLPYRQVGPIASYRQAFLPGHETDALHHRLPSSGVSAKAEATWLPVGR